MSVNRFHGKLKLFAYLESRNWYVEEDFSYTTMVHGWPWKITVRQYFPTDLASTPRIFWAFINRNGWSRGPAVIHDWLTYRNPYEDSYGKDNIKRRKADDIFLEALLHVIDLRYLHRDSFIDRAQKAREVATAWAMYYAVRAYSFTRRQP
jgi:hypothetical protein